MGAAGAQHLADALARNPVIVILSASLPYTYIHFFTQILLTLKLGINGFGDVGAQNLADGLAKNTVILILPSSLSYTHIHFLHRNSPH
jgi:hypothetical protein